ncbi:MULTISPECIES: XrtB/PEP-CTERM-associated transcriptional regulator EpsA [unclassified Nitrosovibrio]|uniref:XrtB/PEP-CTERM-associated transcriptional regulator EpsA n=1 Tax=unclassified Nitrosovibrio TaxID=2624428 RepID=UPI0008AB85B5|nr:XrtB/PEP-CTERM-associated transcriptional regulator EpsA [Nitrosovibrio sp. Nv4]SEO87082.1 transcriptional regulator EpsA [Nitrosovibrio sp. Nv6]SOD42654.1 transcriptional regulator EpsA [Nitrosovibrio sp. Nv4]
MGLPFPLSAENIRGYARITQEWLAVRRHYDLFLWLQGEIQHYLPHEIMLAAWGNFNSNFIGHDIVSALIGVRTEHSDVRSLSPLLQGLFNRWIEQGNTPYTLGVGESGFLLEERGLQCSLGEALQGMQSILIHGISDKRGQHDCLYIIFSSRKQFSTSSMNTIKVLLPYLDAAFGQIDPLPWQPAPSQESGEDFGLSTREIEIMNWTKLGKTTSETAAILGISTFQVKNDLRNILKKLHACNRTQTVYKGE